MRILIIDQCSASKAYDDATEPLTRQEITASPDALLSQHDLNGIEAGDLYVGKQQRRINTAVQTLIRKDHDVDRWFISAGFGLVSASDRLPPYDVTFADMSASEIRKRGSQLNVTEDLLTKLTGSSTYDVVFLPLGKDYYRSIEIDEVLAQISDETLLVLFNREEDATNQENIISIPARTEQAREYGSTVIGLKGTYLKQFAAELDPTEETISAKQVIEYCQSASLSQKSFADFE